MGDSSGTQVVFFTTKPLTMGTLLQNERETPRGHLSPRSGPSQPQQQSELRYQGNRSATSFRKGVEPSVFLKNHPFPVPNCSFQKQVTAQREQVDGHSANSVSMLCSAVPCPALPCSPGPAAAAPQRPAATCFRRESLRRELDCTI